MATVTRVAAAALAALALAGCGRDSYADTDADQVLSEWRRDAMHVETVALPDGREITCVVFVDTEAGGLSCDWEQ